jgi:poly(glycerol-phosphate) alpha-glucosyltransferase
MYTHNLDEENGGMTFSLKTRAKVLSTIGHNVHVITYGFNVKEQFKLDTYTTCNIFEFYSKKRGQTIKPEPIWFDSETEYEDVLSKKNNEKNYRVFSEGEYKQYRRYGINGALTSIDVFMTPWQRTKKYIFKDNTIAKIFYLDNQNRPKLAKYLYHENCYLTSIVDSKTWQDKIFYNHTNGQELDDDDFYLEFLKEYIYNSNIETIFIDSYKNIVLFLKLKKDLSYLKLIFVLHNNHYEDVVNSRVLNKTLKLLFKNLNQFYKIILLTEEQRERVVSEYGYDDKFTVLSNIIEYENLKNKAKIRKNLISIGRYEDVKNMKEVIEVFDLVSKEIEDVRLDLYGYGSQKEELLALIKGKNITVNDFALKPKNIMQESSAFIFTSKHEGQGLVLLECYDAQCPVFSYDVEFGAKDIITDYENGLVILDRSKEKMAKKIVEYINNEFDFKFEKRCSDIFSYQKYVDKIKKILN